MNKFSKIIFILFASSYAHAGWVSSGGESYRNEKNPWFVKNTKEIHYCVQIDESSVTATPSTVKESIKKAFSYWKEQLELKTIEPGITRVGDQTPIEGECSSNTDIIFKIGYEALNEEEIKFLVEPRKYIGVTIRKEYDNVNMKGKGIIFISSDVGSQTYLHSDNLIEKAWSKPNLLQYALTHELGHVMGIAHTGIGVMSETFLTQILNKNGWTYYASRPMLNFILPINIAEVCLTDMSDFFAPTFFGLAPEDRCFKLERQSPTQWSAHSRAATNSSQYRQVGELKVTGSNQGLSPKPLIFVYLPEEQEVFASSDIGFTNFLVAAMTRPNNVQGNYFRTGSMKPYNVQVVVDSESIQISGIVGTEIKPVFFHALPGLKGVVFP